MYRFFKRTFDIIISFLSLVLLSWLLLITAVAVKIESKGPAIFKQDRLGKDGKTFKIYKFRSMRVGAEHTGSGVYSGKGDARVTRIGKIIRATSIDELPQLVNILKGDMSLIGPRPPLTYHPWTVDKYTESQFRMFSVRPGVTGWAQINGRKDVEWNKRIELNCWYTEHISFFLDLKIFFISIFKVFTNADNKNTTETAAQAIASKENESEAKETVTAN